MKNMIVTFLMMSAACAAFAGEDVVNQIGRPMIFIDGRRQGIPLRDVKADTAIPVRLSETKDSFSAQKAFTGDDWQCFELTFTPEKSGRVTVVPHVDGVRRDKDGKLPYAWFYCDDITVEGAELKNGGFEDSSDSFKPWGQFGPGDVKSLLTEDAYGVHSGKRALKLFAGAPVGQGIQVTENVPVTIRMWSRRPASAEE